MRLRVLFLIISLSLVVTASLSAQTKKSAVWKTYHNSDFGVSFSYPADFRVKIEDGNITITPRRPQKRSNGEYYFKIMTGPDTPVGNEDAGMNDAKPPKGLRKTRTVSGSKFELYAASDAGAGQYYYAYGYSGVVTKSVWDIEYKEHTSPISNYGYKVTELNTSRAPRILVHIMNSLKITN